MQLGRINNSNKNLLEESLVAPPAKVVKTAERGQREAIAIVDIDDREDFDEQLD